MKILLESHQGCIVEGLLVEKGHHICHQHDWEDPTIPDELSHQPHQSPISRIKSAASREINFPHESSLCSSRVWHGLCMMLLQGPMVNTLSRHRLFFHARMILLLHVFPAHALRTATQVSNFWRSMKNLPDLVLIRSQE